MLTLVLAGYSTKNKEWGMDTAKQVGGKLIEWSHWRPALAGTNSEIPKFTVKSEKEKISSKFDEEPINIVAKSIGTLVAVSLVGEIKIKKLILCGIPVEDINEDELRAYNILSDFDASNVIIFQNTDDDHGSFEKVRNFISQINPNIKMIEKPGATHDYPYFEEFKEFLG